MTSHQAQAGRQVTTDDSYKSNRRKRKKKSVAEDLDSLLLMTGSTCLGRLTVEAEHLPAPERTQQTTTVHKAAGVQAAPGAEDR
ncbi:hypothetical protein EYF80_032447 [Liparis tanakae]|uniref:Uncharacterized protein n=1 Tax=Liparis tanakae TaxID=230148 RepID=A0A4Z2GVJ4_9TELE|nr:hypothetical protein EYF80_032447 [Liparis tanakae]